MAVTSSDLTIAESFRFTYNDNVVGSLRANSGGAVGLYANGSIRLRPGGSISNGLLITTTDVTFNGTSLLEGSYTLPAATTNALGGVKVSFASSGTASVDSGTYGNRYGLRIDANGMGYVDIPSPGTSVSWGTTSGNVSPLTVNGTTKNVLLSGWAPDLSGYLPLTAGSAKPLTGTLYITTSNAEAQAIHITAASGTAYRGIYFHGGTNIYSRIASNTAGLLQLFSTGNIVMRTGGTTASGISIAAPVTNQTTNIKSQSITPGFAGAVTINGTTGAMTLGNGIDIGLPSNSFRSLSAKVIYLASGVYLYYDSTNGCVRVHGAGLASDSFVSAGGVSST